ncbi:hypothetical protein ACFYU5_05010 [Nocardia aobensis]|uniref:Uncharacterized protein n=1 Tax=Nocardia aobensis TaxID=257277 RepID=A0ABW6NZJ0_9NOCA
MSSVNSVPEHHGVEIGFDERVTSDQRPFVERSIAALIEQRSERFTRQRSENRKRAEVLRRIHAPLLRIVEQDPEASRALGELRAETWSENNDGYELAPKSISTPSRPQSVELRGFELIGLPYHYDWHWRDGDGPLGPHMTADHTTGKATVDSKVVGSGTWTAGHAGIGVVLTTHDEVAAAARSARKVHTWGAASSAPWGGSATSEGGTEMTVFEDSHLVASGVEKRWRVRTSNGESRYDAPEGDVIADPIEVTWVMRPGSVYTLNVGAWTYCEYHDGIAHQSESISFVDMNVLFIGLDR